LTHTCPECGAEGPIEAVRCGVCGARMVPSEPPPARFTREQIFSYSLSTIGLILLAMSIPCLVGLLCFLLGR
jgi:hypothetical protein